ncbi:hypothetical protein [Hydrogenophaga palleronii]|uniref:hypothetical protein n=1 Tax=Hydrogenophaga palleronii TaxID=65655 RepID=UPI000824DFA4|nr:hypothetical protein [Hydrogenophaga palleronii]
MKALIWGVFGLLALCWTGIAAASVQITGWLLTMVASGEGVDAVIAAQQWPEPGWLAAWIDPAWLKTLQGAWVGMVQWLAQVLPGAGGLMAWVTPLVWTVWALGLLCLLVPALALHWLSGQLKTPASLRSTPPPR